MFIWTQFPLLFCCSFPSSAPSLLQVWCKGSRVQLSSLYWWTGGWHVSWGGCGARSLRCVPIRGWTTSAAAPSAGGGQPLVRSEVPPPLCLCHCVCAFCTTSQLQDKIHKKQTSPRFPCSSAGHFCVFVDARWGNWTRSVSSGCWNGSERSDSRGNSSFSLFSWRCCWITCC